MNGRQLLSCQGIARKERKREREKERERWSNKDGGRQRRTHVEICRRVSMYAYEREGGREGGRGRERMELQLGGKHIIINEAERIAAVDSHVRTGVAISALYPTSLCAIGGVSISFLDPRLTTRSRAWKRNEGLEGGQRLEGNCPFCFSSN